MVAMSDLILSERRGPAAIITLNRPEALNAFPLPMARAFEQAVRAAVADPEVVGIVVTGAGRGFCAGLDLDHVHGRSPTEMHEVLSALYVEMNEVQAKLGKPTIAAVTGAARGRS